MAVRFGEDHGIPMPGASASTDSRTVPHHLLVRVLLHWSDGPEWTVFCGEAVKSSPDGQLCVEVKGPGTSILRLTVPSQSIIPHPPLSPAGRLPEGYLKDLLHYPPAGAQELGIGVVAAEVPKLVWEKLSPWHGVPVGGKEPALSSEQWHQVTDPSSHLVDPHPGGGAAAPVVPEPEVAAVDEKLQKHWKRLDRSGSPRRPSRGRSSRSGSGASGRGPSADQAGRSPSASRAAGRARPGPEPSAQARPPSRRAAPT